VVAIYSEDSNVDSPARQFGTANSWHGLHLHFAGSLYGEACDRIVLAIVDPLSRRLGGSGFRDAFFVRYTDATGSHVRLRMRAPARIVTAVTLDMLGLAPTPSSHQRGKGQDQAWAAGLGSVRWASYEAEQERYGGPAAIGIAEQIFCASSGAAISLLRINRRSRDRLRRGIALLAMVTTVREFCADPSVASAVFDQIRSSYLGRVKDPANLESSLNRFDMALERQRDNLTALVVAGWARQPLPPAVHKPVLRYVEQLRDGALSLRSLCAEDALRTRYHLRPTWEQFVVAVVPSYLHMMNNRLGIGVPEEAFLAHVATRSLHATF
jgi:thiopeptide-type bacteriocin biosynthesis protein